MYFSRPKLREFPFPTAYILSLVMVLAATILTSGLWLIADRPISAPLFLAAIVFSTWIGGIRVGIFSAFLSGVAIDYYFVQPFYAFTWTRDEVLRLTLFFGEGILLSWLVERLYSASEEIRTSREELRQLTEYQQTLRESEQKRIALEIHDELGGALTGLKMDAHFISRSIQESVTINDRDLILKSVDDLSYRIDKTIGTVRRIASELRPSILDDFGLIAASEWQAREFQRTSEIKCSFSSDVEDLDLGPDANTAVFRILQEALTNVVRHASASSVSVALSKLPDEVTMTVVDDGKGIDQTIISGGRSLGLIGMRERCRLIGGHLEILDRPSGGTMVELKIPLSGAA